MNGCSFCVTRGRSAAVAEKFCDAVPPVGVTGLYVASRNDASDSENWAPASQRPGTSTARTPALVVLISSVLLATQSYVRLSSMPGARYRERMRFRNVSRVYAASNDQRADGVHTASPPTIVLRSLWTP